MTVASILKADVTPTRTVDWILIEEVGQIKNYIRNCFSRVFESSESLLGGSERKCKSKLKTNTPISADDANPFRLVFSN